MSRSQGVVEITEIDVDGIIPRNTPNIELIGKATRHDGEWRCLANVEGNLCVVAVKVTAL